MVTIEMETEDGFYFRVEGNTHTFYPNGIHWEEKRLVLIGSVVPGKEHNIEQYLDFVKKIYVQDKPYNIPENY